ncbi:MAG: Fe-S cluster assembly protein SufD [Lysobacterales bacterium]|nr:MAG: Fe-S cluster assembly protein SufD [Xanthomonadales bacterium]
MTTLAEKWTEALAATTPSPAPTWLRELRDKAGMQFRAGGLPHRKVEAWKYTPLRVLEGFELAPPVPAQSPAPARTAGRAMDVPAPLCERAAVIDICDGATVDLPVNLPEGVRVMPLAEGLERFEERLRPLFEAVELGGATRAFTALNTALAQQGLVVHVARARNAGPDAGRLLLRWYFSPGAAAAMHHFRVFLLLDDGARLDLVEQFMYAWGSERGGTGSTAAGLNLLCQAELGAGAVLEHTRVQAESEQAVLLTSTTLEQAADSRYTYRGFDLGASLARHELTTRLRGRGAVADIAGAWVLDGQRHADNHVCVEHLAPGCRSEQFFRGVLGGRSRGVFNGRALIRPGADGSSVRQSNANLLLSPLAEMDTKPELEIYADEVEASHGATVGQLDEAAVFYLRSRGLGAAAARRMLTSAFCRTVTDRVKGRGLAERIAELMDAAMPEAEL